MPMHQSFTYNHSHRNRPFHTSLAKIRPVRPKSWLILYCGFSILVESRIQHQASTGVTHSRSCSGLVCQQMQRLQPTLADAGIFARGFLLTPTSRPTTGAHNRSSRDRPLFSLGAATRRRTSWRALRVSAHFDSAPSIYVDSASP